MPTDPANEIFDIVDEEDNVVGTEKRSVVHQKGLLHRSVHVFVLDSRGRIFVQLRSLEKDIGSGLWDLSVAEHLKPGESFEEAALRGVLEELGVELLKLQCLGKENQFLDYGAKKDNEKIAVFRCFFRGKIRLQKEEIEKGRWVSKKELLKEMHEKQEKFTPWLLLDKKFFHLL